MANPDENNPIEENPETQDPNLEQEPEDEEEEELEEVVAVTQETRLQSQRAKLNTVKRRLSTEELPLRVHDVIIKGNTKTKDSVIEAEIEEVFKEASSMQEILKAAAVANARLKNLDVFDSVNITLDSGPSELPGTANVVVQVVEAKKTLTGDLGVFTKPEARSWTLEGSLKKNNIFGYGDIWDGSCAYGLDQTSEISAGVFLPRFRGLNTPVTARASLLSQDWLKYSSYKERSMGMSLGLFSNKNHDLAYNLMWRTLTDPSQLASRSVRTQLGHSLLSALKYTYKIDTRDSPLRPKKGYTFASTSQIGGLWPDSRSLKFIRQDFDLRYAFPLGLFNSAVNLGVSVGGIIPLGRGFMNTQSPLPERFFMGGHSSLVCSLSGPTTLLGFSTRGLGPTEQRRPVPDPTNGENLPISPGRDVLGGDFAATAFADLSFDLPVKVFRDAGIHGHAFVCGGSVLSKEEIKNFSAQRFRDSFRVSAGYGVVVPTKLFRVEANYCYVLKRLEHDRAKTGIQFSFSI